MKATTKIFILFLAVNLVLLMAPQKATAQVSVSFQIFYDDLSPYGFWIDSPEYGYSWVPNVSSSFSPYRTNGYWVFTEVGWTWVSNYPWGWAPFHYGRWYYDSYYGWIWVPGYDWGPGWVIWRRSESFYGWAPIGPGISISIAYSSGYSLPYNYWTCVRNRDFGRTNIYNYYESSSNNSTIINNSTVVNNIREVNSTRVRYNAGPDKAEVQRRTGSTFATIALRERNRPGQNMSNKELEIYKPRVKKNGTTGREPSPPKIMRMEDVKPVAQRNVVTQPERENQPKSQQHQQRSEQQRSEQEIKLQQIHQQAKEQETRNQQMKQGHQNDPHANQQQIERQVNEQQARQQQMHQQMQQQGNGQQDHEQQRNESHSNQQQKQQHDH